VIIFVHIKYGWALIPNVKHSDTNSFGGRSPKFMRYYVLN